MSPAHVGVALLRLHTLGYALGFFDQGGKPFFFPKLFLVDQEEHLKGSVPLARLFNAPGATPLKDLAIENQISVDVDEKQDRVTELFDSNT